MLKGTKANGLNMPNIFSGFSGCKIWMCETIVVFITRFKSFLATIPDNPQNSDSKSKMVVSKMTIRDQSIYFYLNAK